MWSSGSRVEGGLKEDDAGSRDSPKETKEMIQVRNDKGLNKGNVLGWIVSLQNSYVELCPSKIPNSQYLRMWPYLEREYIQR